MLLYKGCEFFVENTPQVHSSMKASFLFDRFTNISKGKVSSIFPCKSPESLKQYRGIIKQLDYCSIRTLTQCYYETLYSMIWNMYSKGYRHRFGNNFLFVLASSFFLSYLTHLQPYCNYESALPISKRALLFVITPGTPLLLTAGLGSVRVTICNKPLSNASILMQFVNYGSVLVWICAT